MTTTTKTPRLLEAAKEFNIGRDTLVKFLVEKGFETSNNPSAKLTEKMYNALQVEFAQDKAVKRKSDEIALPKGMEGHRKPGQFDQLPRKEEPRQTIAEKILPSGVRLPGSVAVDNKPKPQDQTTAIPVQTPAHQPVNGTVKPPVAVAPIVVAPVAKPVVEAPPVVVHEHKPEPQVKVEPPVALHVPEKPVEVKLPEPPKTIPVVEEVKKPAPIPEAVTVVPEVVATSKVVEAPVKPEKQVEAEKPVPVPAPVPQPEVKPQPETPRAEEYEDSDYADDDHSDDKTAGEQPEHISIKAPKIGGPNVLGKIDLDNMNLASRPKKGSNKKKEEERKPKPATPARTAQPHTTGQSHAPHPAHTPAPTHAPRHAQPHAEERHAPRPVVTPDREVRPDEEATKPEHIEMKAPKLEGPKIIGKIELPVAQPSGGVIGNRGDSKEKRKRKRIPVDKKPESFRPDAGRDARPGGVAPGGVGNRGHQHGPNQGTNQRSDGNRERRPGDQPGFGQRFGGDNRNAGGGGGHQRPGGSGGGNTRPAPGNRPSRDNFADRRNAQQRPQTPAQQTEIDTKAIQDKIRETQAKLSGSTRSKNLKAKYRRNKRDEMADRRAAAENAEQNNVIQVTEFISVSELASLLNVSFAEVISKCMSLGIMVSINQRLDAEVIELVASEFDYEVEFINLEQAEEEEVEEVDDDADLVPRAPIVTIMGHVDHGKTSLLDYVRSANVVAGEAGGITQHIGAYQVTTTGNKKITFLDTPGHEAFTAMRARGAKVADVAVIVVAADDAIMPQTKEAISHAQAANLPMIFAINKIDKEGANPEKIKEQLANMNLLVEDWGGSFQSQEISAKKGTNVDLLLEKIGLEAEMLELKANPARTAAGSVIEASLDKGRGYLSTILVQNGTLSQGDMIVCGQYFGKIKAMFNERGARVKMAVPSTPVQVLGLNGAPQAGEKFRVFEDEDEAKDLANHRAQILREQGIRARKHITLDEIGRRLALGNFKELGIIIKGDFDGSVEALSDSLQKLSTQEVAVNIVHKGVGQITESDVLLATASDAIIVGFQVRPSSQAAKLAVQENIEIRAYSIIYDAIEEVKSAMEGLLEPKVEKKTVCNIEVRETFKISGVGTIAGCYVLDGKVTRQTKINLIRDGIVVFTGELGSLKRHKDDVKEVNAGYECGLAIKNYNDVRVGDVLEGYEEVEVKRTLS